MEDLGRRATPISCLPTHPHLLTQCFSFTPHSSLPDVAYIHNVKAAVKRFDRHLLEIRAAAAAAAAGAAASSASQGNGGGRPGG